MTPVIEHAFGEWLRQTRTSRGLTQRQLGLPQGTIAAYETGRRRPKTATHIARLAAALQCPIETVATAAKFTNLEREKVQALMQEDRWSDAYAILQQWRHTAYRDGNTNLLMRCQSLQQEIAQRSFALTPDLAVQAAPTPYATFHLASLTFRRSQWLAAQSLLGVVEDSLPAQSPLWGDVYYLGALIQEALGNSDAALAKSGNYVRWALAVSDQWRTVLARALQLRHLVLWKPEDPAIHEHLPMLERWRDPHSGEPDPHIACWRLDTLTRLALQREDFPEAHRHLQSYTKLVAANPTWRVKHLRWAEVSALYLSLRGRPKIGVRLLRSALVQPRHVYVASYIRSEVVQTLARLTKDVEVWRSLMQTYWVLGAKGWREHLLPEWQAVDPEATLEMPPLFLSV